MNILFLRLASYFGSTYAHPENVMMPVDLATMISTARIQGHQPSLVDTEAVPCSRESLLHQMRRLKPDLMVLKGKTASAQAIRELVGEMGCPTIGIGQAFVSDQEQFLSAQLPFVCTIEAEPEATFAQLLENLAQQKSIDQVPGLVLPQADGIRRTKHRELLDDLDQLPRPAYELFLNQRYHSHYPSPRFLKKRMAFMLSSRGCPMRCIFCSPTLRQSHGSHMRFHSVERVVEEMRNLKRQGVTIVQFRDDTFTADRARTARLCRALIREGINLPWMCQSHVNFVDEELLLLMRQAGLISIGLGIESGSEQVLARLRKSTDLSRARRIFSFCRRRNIATVAFFLLGCPDETREDLEQTTSLARELRPNLIQVALFTPYPGSSAFEQLPLSTKNELRDSGLHHYNHLAYNPSAVDEATLLRVQRLMYLQFLFHPRNLLSISGDLLAGMLINPAITKRLLSSGSLFLLKRLLPRRSDSSPED